MSLNIDFVCWYQNVGYHWADPSYDQGIGGSEECLILLSRLFASMGHRVRVFNYCGPLAGVYHGVEWIDFDKDFKDYNSDLLVCWRLKQCLNGIKAKRIWYWAHDIAICDHCPRYDEIDNVEIVVCHNEFHRSLFINDNRIPPEKCWVGGVGVDVSLFKNVNVTRIPGRVITVYDPSRGLHVLRDLWPKVREKVPYATLASFWWREEAFPYYKGDPSLGIMDMRRLKPDEVAVEMLRSSVFAYPSFNFVETGSLSTMKAQCGGAIPVFHPLGGLAWSPNIEYAILCNEKNFLDSLIYTLLNEDRFYEFRLSMMRDAHKRFDWSFIARRWLDKYYGQN